MSNAHQLEQRPLGRTNISVSRLGLAGSFGIGADDVERAFHELGINYFFVTPRMKGLTEGIARLIAAGHREQLVIASGASIPTGGSVGREWAKTAKRFGIETIDVFHLFWVQAKWYVTGKTWPAMQRLKEEGKARALAISCHKRQFALQMANELDLDVLMLRYNAAHRGAETDVLQHLEEDPSERVGVVSYTATRWGKLLKPLKEHPPMTAPECYRFCLGHPKVDVALCGARSYAELLADVQGIEEGPLAEPRLSQVKAFGDAVRSKSKIGWGS